MNYPNYYPNYYSQPVQQMQPQQMQPQQAQVQMLPTTTQQNTQIQNGGYITVRSEEEARNYPLAPGNSMTFFNETQPYCYKKTMSFSPLDHPTFKRYKIVEEDVAEDVVQEQEEPAWKTEIDTLREELEELKARVKTLVPKTTTKGVKKNGTESE